LTITLDGNEYTHIIDTGFSEIKEVQLPEWINDEMPDIDTSVWNRSPLKITYLMRVTNAEKWTLDQILLGHQKVYIEDTTYNIRADVWLMGIEAIWEADINWSKPWRIEIELVTIELIFEGDYTTWAIYDSFDDDKTEGNTDCQYALVNASESVALLIELWYLGVRKYTIATKTLGALEDEYLHAGWYHAQGPETLARWVSLQFTYVVGLVRSGTKGNGIGIWKDGVLIQSFTAAELGMNASKVYSVSISRSGRYIFVSGERTATSNVGWVVLVGS